MPIDDSPSAGRRWSDIEPQRTPAPRRDPASASIASSSAQTDDLQVIARSQGMAAVCAAAARVAAGDAKVLITGESGVGKDLVARLIHVRSPRANRALVTVNCGAFTETLLETELFGHVKGSFTDAYRDKQGKLVAADGGTAFLDEVGEMSLRMQTLLLRFLENGEVQPVGADGRTQKVNVRVIAATNRDLDEMVAAGTFRQDLLYRLKVVHIKIPPLRERREDIRPLIEHILTRTGRAITFTESALANLERYRWPGNVRELQNVIEQLAWATSSDTIDVAQLPTSLNTVADGRVKPVRERRRQVADDLFAGLVSAHFTFWEHVHKLFLDRDITRHDIRELVRRGLAHTYGNYKATIKLFGMPDEDYKRFRNFLDAHDCRVDYRPYRNGNGPAAARPGHVSTKTPGGKLPS